MNYATWKLNFTDPNYGTGPEAAIVALGGAAESSWANGPVEAGATILGYVSGPQNESALAAWHFTNISQEDALAFCSAINPEAYLLENGRIGAPMNGLPL